MTEYAAIRIPHPLLSKAVQRKLFDMGYKWSINNTQNNIVYPATTSKIFYIIYSSNDKPLKWYTLPNVKKWGYTILTVDQFFAREEEKEEEIIGGYEMYRVHDITGIKNNSGFGFKIEDHYVVLTWPEYDQIGTLRPREARGMGNPDNVAREASHE